MPKKAVTKQDLTLATGAAEPEAPALDELEEADLEDAREIAHILQQNAMSGGEIGVSRRGPSDEKMQYVGRVPVEGFSLDQLKQRYGGGDYHLRFFRQDGRIFKRRDVSIDYRFKGKLDEQANGKDHGAGRSQEAMLQLLQQSADKSQTLLITMMMESNKLLMTTMAGMFQALGARPADNGLTALVPVLVAMANGKGDFMPLLAELIKSNNKSDIGGLVAAVKELRELAADDKDEDMLDKVSKLAAPWVTAMMHRQLPPLPDPMALPPDTAEAAPAVETPPDDMLLGKWKVYADMLHRAAERDADPADYANVILDQVDDQQLEQLLAALAQDDWLDKLCILDSRARKHAAWLGELRKSLLEPDAAEPEANPGAED